MARHIDEVQVTREGLLHRYARLHTEDFWTYGMAADVAADWSLSDLQDVVEALESHYSRPDVTRGARRSFAASQPTTTIQGIAR